MGDTSEYQIFETDEFTRKIGKLSDSDARTVRSKLESYAYPQLREQPFWGANVRKLRGFRTDVRRYRIGRFRVFYTVNEIERVVSILTVEARKDAYR